MVRERRQKADNSADATTLTKAIMGTESASQLLVILQASVKSPIFNYFHMSAAFTKLAKFHKRGLLRAEDVRSSAWPKLGNCLQGMLMRDELNPRAVANVFWSYGDLYEDFSNRLGTSLSAFAKAIRLKAPDMDARQVSNCFLTIAKLAKVYPEIEKQVTEAVPSLVKHIKMKAADMNAQDVANNFWAAATLQDASPVACLADSLPYLVSSMKSQELATCLWAVANLKKKVPTVLVVAPALAERIPKKVDDLNTQGLAMSLWSAAKLRKETPEVLEMVPALSFRIATCLGAIAMEGLRMSLWAAEQLGEDDLQAKLSSEIAPRKL